ncbi:MAG: L,D-transpeptidase, partial [Rhizobiales bacterium]|nr:L,D-transpeptidase [Hyphomicrobiales bacterium]
MTEFPSNRGPQISRRKLIAGAIASALPLPLAYPALADENDPYPLPPFDYKKLPKPYRRTVVEYTGHHRPGTIIVNTSDRQLYLIMDGGQAIRYGCAVGKDGFRWAGLADVSRKVMWPTWTPPKEMIERHPEKAKWA